MTATAMVTDVFDFLDGIEVEIKYQAKQNEVSELMLWMLVKQLAGIKLEQLSEPNPQ